MGYTHYVTQNRSLTADEWETISTDIKAILNFVKHECSIPLAGGMGEAGTFPEITSEFLSFNGLGDGSHETLYITRELSEENWNFCKTAQKPYDLAVTAVLSYLSTVTRDDEMTLGSEAFSVTSDGDSEDWLLGVDAAKQAVPSKANRLDIPLDIMKADRWMGPWLHLHTKRYEFHFCINGKAYLFPVGKEAEAYCFNTHAEAGKWLADNRYARHEKDIWNAYGSFDKARIAKLASAQTRAMKKKHETLMFDWVSAEHAEAPPAFVRPSEMPKEKPQAFRSVSDLMNSLEGTK